MDTTAIVSILKWLFPSIVGSVLAVYYKAKEVGISKVPKEDLLRLILLGFGCLFVGIFVAYILGGLVIEVWDIPHTQKLYMLVYFIAGFSGTKLVDAIARNMDSWVDKIINTISKVIDKILSKFM